MIHPISGVWDSEDTGTDVDTSAPKYVSNEFSGSLSAEKIIQGRSVHGTCLPPLGPLVAPVIPVPIPPTDRRTPAFEGAADSSLEETSTELRKTPGPMHRSRKSKSCISKGGTKEVELSGDTMHSGSGMTISDLLTILKSVLSTANGESSRPSSHETSPHAAKFVKLSKLTR